MNDAIQNENIMISKTYLDRNFMISDTDVQIYKPMFDLKSLHFPYVL